MRFIVQKNDSKLLISHILLCMACMNFLKRGSILFFLFVLWTTFGIVLKNKKVVLDRSFIFPFFLTLGMFFSSIMYYGASEIIKSINYFLAFVVGYNLIYKTKKRSETAKNFIASIYSGFLIYLFLTFVKNNSIGFSVQRRLIYEFWKGEPVAVTLIGLLCSVIIGYSFYGILLQKNKILKIICVFSLWLTLIINIKTATRTPFVLFVCIYLMMGSIYFINSKMKNKLKMIILICIFIGMILFCVLNNTFGIRDYILESSIFKRVMVEGFKTSRNDISEYYLEYFFEHIWGGRYIFSRVGRLAHNFILEAHDNYGIVTTISLLGITFEFLKNTLKMIKIRNKNAMIYLFISMYGAIFIQISLEPVFEGYPVLVMCFIFLHGMIIAYLKKGKASYKMRREDNNENYRNKYYVSR